MKLRSSKNKGFTIVELMVSISIFVFMTVFLLAKYGTFNQGILLTNLAYDVALTIRNAQSYGLNVKSAPGATGGTGPTYSNNFSYPYGVHFDKSNGNNAKMIFFVDSDAGASAQKVYAADENISSYSIKRGSIISGICVGSGSCDGSTVVNTLDISFKRPDPDAIITINGSNALTYGYAEIMLKSTDGGLARVSVRSNGQIVILNY